jgi:hypothetical protein
VAVPVAQEPPGILSVELFPEGGDLSAGVPNRVYFEARDHRGRAAALTGVLLDRQMREIVAVRGAAEDRGLGVFEFTPEPGETYTLRARAPGTVEMRTALPRARADGVALTIPDGVGREGEPLRVTVRDPLGRRLLVLAECRGRVVDQQTVKADRAGTEVVLAPVPGTRGVVRVTACALGEGRLVPLAERLAYRSPAEYLRLSVTDAAGKLRTEYHPGEHADLKVKVTTETGAPTAAVLLGAFVDRKWLAGELSPAAQFYLGRAVRHPQELDDADFLLADNAQARRALDLFLGTHGWRRLVTTGQRDEGTAVARNEKRTGSAVLALAPAVLLADNRTRVLEESRTALARRQADLRQQAVQERKELTDERDSKFETASRALAALRDYEDLPREYLWRGLVGVVLLLFTLGSLFLAAGVLRVVRGKGSSRASFSVAFVALALCAGAYSLTISLRDAQPGATTVAGLRPRELPPLDTVGEAQQQAARQALRPRQVFTLTSADQTADRADGKGQGFGEGGGTAKGGGKAKSSEGPAGDTKKKEDRNLVSSRLQGSEQYNRRFTELLHAPEEKARLHPGTSPQPASAPTGGLPSAVVPTTSLPGGRGDDPKNAADGAKGAEARTHAVLRQFAYRQTAGAVDPQDTLLWQPALEAKDGTARLEFDLSSNVTTYQLWLYGHSPSGRLGVYRANVQTWR